MKTRKSAHHNNYVRGAKLAVEMRAINKAIVGIQDKAREKGKCTATITLGELKLSVPVDAMVRLHSNGKIEIL